MKTCRILVPIGSMGGIINTEAFENGIAMKPDIIAADAGSTDSGPAYLTKGICKRSHRLVRRDFEIAVTGAMQLGVPLFVGSCGTCGTDNMVDYCAEIVEEICREKGFKAKIAKIYSQQDPKLLQQKWDEGKIHALEGAPEITRDTFTECANIVGVLGAEPFIEAYRNGANIVLAGRTTDTAIIAAYPILMGCNEAASWHGAKTAECGAQCADRFDGRGIFLSVDEKGFAIRPLLPDAHCTPYTVAAHLLYENADPFCLREPSGTMYTKDAVYTQIDEYTTYVTGTRFEHADQYTVKLEGGAVAGYQNISLVGVANPKVLADPEKWARNMGVYVMDQIAKTDISPEDYSFNFKFYGYNAVVDGPVPEGTPTPKEIGVLLTVTARTQELADEVAQAFGPALLHFPADFNEQMPSFAFPFSPADTSRGPTYEFKLNHVVDVDDPMELARIQYIEV